MTPGEIVAAIKAGFEFGTELLRFLQTAQGKALLEQSMRDRTATDKFFADAASAIGRFVKGDLFK